MTASDTVIAIDSENTAQAVGCHAGEEVMRDAAAKAGKSAQLEQYDKDLTDAKDPQLELKLGRAVSHVSTLNIGAHAFDSAKAFFDRRDRLAPVKLIVAEDNEAVIKILVKGRTSALRHVHRTHRINIDWLVEVCSSDCVRVKYVNTTAQIADMLTKHFSSVPTWENLVRLSQIRLPNDKCPSVGSILPTNQDKSSKPKATLCCHPIRMDRSRAAVPPTRRWMRYKPMRTAPVSGHGANIRILSF